MTKRRGTFLGVCSVLALFLIACGPTSSPTPRPTSSPTPRAAPGATGLPWPTVPAVVQPAVVPTATPDGTADRMLASSPASPLPPDQLPQATSAPPLGSGGATTPPPAPTPVPTPTPTPTPTPPPPEDTVVIECIFYDGQVPTTEADEYVQIANLGTTSVALGGWRLKDVSDGSPNFTFPTHALAPGKRVRVYTNENHPEWGGFSFGRSQSIWNNQSPDVAALFNAQGKEVSRKSYPPGC